ncbi:MAG: chorismate synthase [Candidatus Dormibacteria bacterium]
MLRLLTAGESHGPQLTAILEGLPAGVPVDARAINHDLGRRQGGYGRGGRQKIEHDQVEIVGGVRAGRTLGGPVALVVRNRDWENWKGPMQVEADGFRANPVTRLRPGHADLPGALKYGTGDVRDILERSSARETAARVAAGSVARSLLSEFGVRISSWTVSVGEVVATVSEPVDPEQVDASPLRCPDAAATLRMVEAVDRAREAGDTLGGVFTVRADGLCPGIGSHVHWDRKLDGLIAQAMMSIQAVKGVAIGDAWKTAALPGSQVQDEILYDPTRGFHSATNRSGGILGGMTSGMPLEVTCALKPISTLLKPLNSVDLATRAPVKAHYERSDVCVVPAAGVIGEAVLATVLAGEYLRKFGGDSLAEMRRNHDAFVESTR